MKISRRSWHYRLYQFECGVYNLFEFHGNYTIPSSLCKYFWAIVGMIAIFPFALLAFIVAVIALGPFYWYFEKSETHEKRVAKKRAKRLIEEPEVRQPGLVRSFLHAKHEKLCPLLEVVD